MNFIEKRIFRRLNAEIPVDVEMEHKTIHTTTSNICCGGMFLKVDPTQIAGKRRSFELVVHLPNHKSPVRLIAEVQRKEKGIRHGVAVKFEGLYNDNILAIEKFVKSNLN